MEQHITHQQDIDYIIRMLCHYCQGQVIGSNNLTQSSFVKAGINKGSILSLYRLNHDNGSKIWKGFLTDFLKQSQWPWLCTQHLPRSLPPQWHAGLGCGASIHSCYAWALVGRWVCACVRVCNGARDIQRPSHLLTFIHSCVSTKQLLNNQGAIGSDTVIVLNQKVNAMTLVRARTCRAFLKRPENFSGPKTDP